MNGEEFNIEKAKSGNYLVFTREGSKVKIIDFENEKTNYPLVVTINGEPVLYDKTGKSIHSPSYGAYVTDLILVTKDQELTPYESRIRDLCNITIRNLNFDDNYDIKYLGRLIKDIVFHFHPILSDIDFMPNALNSIRNSIINSQPVYNSELSLFSDIIKELMEYSKLMKSIKI